MKQFLRTVGKKSARNKLRNVKFTQWEDDQISHLSEKFCAGNRSEWIRYASLNFRPRLRDLIEMDVDEPKTTEHDARSVPTPA
jgi:hypothetical protein